MSEKRMLWQAIFSGALFMIGIGLSDLNQPGLQRAGIGLTLLGSVFAILAFVGLKKAAKVEGPR